jgi:2-oxoisovalerate dehydrogenase E1 component
MAREPAIVVFGEDVADASREEALDSVTGKGGVFKVTHGLQRLYGSDRVFNSPLAEANIIGRAVGMALARPEAGGRDPVLRLHLAGVHADPRRDGDDALPLGQPLVVPDGDSRADRRLPRGGAPYHSQSGVAIFAHSRASASRFRRMPGRRRPAAHRDPLRRSGAVPRAQASLPADVQQVAVPGPGLHDPFGSAAVVRDGTDVVVFTWGALVQRSLLAAQQAEKDGISVAVVDLRTIIPYDWDTIAEYTRKTNRRDRRA